MSMQPGQEGTNPVVLNGHVATMRFRIDVGYSPELTQFARTREVDTIDQAIATALNRDMHQELYQAVKLQVIKTLGPGFDLESLVIQTGSIEIIAIITAAAVVLRSYNDFAEQLGKALENTRSIINSMLAVAQAIPRPQFTIQGNWFPGSALTTAQGQATNIPPSAPPTATTSTGASPPNTGRVWSSSQGIFFWALITDLILLGILLVLLIRR
jgi:hypothetical protein